MHLTQFFDLGPRNEYCSGLTESGGQGGHNLSNSNLGGDFSAVFLQRQKWIVNYYVKKFVKELMKTNNDVFLSSRQKMI